MAFNPVNSSTTLADSVADLNNAMDDIVGCFHGSSQPSAPESYMLWADTTLSNATLKIRNGSNAGWIPLYWMESQSGPIASNGSNDIRIVAPSSTTTYTLTLPTASQLPSSGNHYLLVDSSGNLSFSATGP